jgi:hypothetical protein
MEVIEALRTSILEPHEHLHINHVRASGRSVHATQITRFGRNASGQGAFSTPTGTNGPA